MIRKTPFIRVTRSWSRFNSLFSLLVSFIVCSYTIIKCCIHYWDHLLVDNFSMSIDSVSCYRINEELREIITLSKLRKVGNM
jgi:hypothetical protein